MKKRKVIQKGFRCPGSILTGAAAVAVIVSFAGCAEETNVISEISQGMNIEEDNDANKDVNKDNYIEADIETDIETNPDRTIQENFAMNRELPPEIEAVYREVQDRKAEPGSEEELQIQREMIAQLSVLGYSAVDSRNQIDLAGAKEVLTFCSSVENQMKDALTILIVYGKSALVQYEFATESGEIFINRTYYEYKNSRMNYAISGQFKADFWELTEEGYLMFEGSWISEESLVLTMSDVPERAAIRVQPLDGVCRELNRKYLLPIGYQYNNMFITDWNEQDYGDLQFYDLYDIFYPIVNQRAVPYEANENLNVVETYQIPQNEFERVIQKYFKIDSGTLQAKTVWKADSKTYEYEPRGFYNSEYSEVPYPEVTACTQNSDNTITLTVQVVYPNECTSKVFVHEVVVRPLEDGGVQYVSNKVIPSEENREITWHVAR